MTAIKRSSADQLRNRAPVDRKVMLVWDKACIDCRNSFKIKHINGTYFVTLEKSTSVAEACSINLFDRGDPRNEEVVSDHLVDSSTAVALRRVVYINPEDGATYACPTSHFTLSAYQIVPVLQERLGHREDL